jgi:3-hydroxyacyl-[acyl-carrier-protein] dehydratase
MTALNLHQIKQYLPHRYPFLMVDAVDAVVLGESIVARKAVTGNEAFFLGHFPGNPVVPGVLQIEAMGQAGVLLAILSGAKVDHEHTLYVTSITDCRFRRPVTPGDVMELRAKVVKKKLGTWKLDCEVWVAGQPVSSASVSATSGPKAKAPALPEAFPAPIYEDPA